MDKMEFQRRFGYAIVVLALSLLATFAIWQYTQTSINRRMSHQFNREILAIESEIQYRVGTYINALYGLQSLFETPETITRVRFMDYCEKLNPKGRYPGLLYIAYSQRIVADDLEAFVQNVRSDTSMSPNGYPDFEVFSMPHLSDPMDEQEEHYVVNYIWPWAAREVHGFDVFSDAVRRTAVERARDTGKPSATQKTVLAIDVDESIPGFLVFLPVYRFGAPISTVAERRLAIRGMVVALFRTHELLGKTIGDMSIMPHINIEAFDGADASAAHLYYDTDSVIHALDQNYQPRFAAKRTLEIAGQTWALHFFWQPQFGLDAIEQYLPLIVLGMGMCLSALLTGLVSVQAHSRWRALKITEDVTRKLEEQNALVMRSDRLRALGEMAAGIAHELNQPLVGVRGLAEHLLIGMDRGWEMTNEKVQDRLSLIIEQADRMTHIIEHVRIFSREAGKPELQKVDVNDVVQSGVDLLGTQFRSRRLSLETDLAHNLPKVLVNPFSLEEVILNLMSNARDAVQERLERDPDMASPEVLLRTQTAQMDGDRIVQIEVIDNGLGIPFEMQDKIFDPFFTTKAPQKGTGLGLSISQSIVESFDGTLHLEPVEPHGTRAKITLPIYKETHDDA